MLHIQGVDSEQNRANELIYPYIFLILIAILLRTIYTIPTEITDALIKWVFVKDLLDGAPLSSFIANHHTSRWGVNIPTLAFAYVFGWRWFTYYLVLIVFFAIFLILSAGFFRKYHLGILSFSIFILVIFANPSYFRATTQLLPFVFVVAFMMFHVVFLARAMEKQRQVDYFLAALFIFFAYGAKETALLYAPGSALFVLLALGWRRGLAALACIGAYGLLFIAIETAAISLIAGELVPTGRLALLSRHFQAVDSLYGKFRFSGLFEGWRNLPPLTAMFFTAALASSIYLIIDAVRQRRVRAIILPSLLFLSFAFFHTFAVKSISPLIPALPPNAKYLADLVPWGSLAIGIAVGDLTAKIANRRYATALPISALALAAVICVVSLARPGQDRGIYPLARAWMWHADESYGLLRRLVLAGVPIRREKRDPRDARLRDLLGLDLIRLEESKDHVILGAPGTETGRRTDFCIDGRKLRTQLDLVPCPIPAEGK